MKSLEELTDDEMRLVSNRKVQALADVDRQGKKLLADIGRALVEMETLSKRLEAMGLIGSASAWSAARQELKITLAWVSAMALQSMQVEAKIEKGEVY